MVVMNTVRLITYPLLFIQRALNGVLLIRTGFISSVSAMILSNDTYMHLTDFVW